MNFSSMTSSSMVDSLLSLLVKAHARLYWNRLVNGVDVSARSNGSPNSVSQDSPFLNLSTQIDSAGTTSAPASTESSSVIAMLSARCMAILNNTNASNSSTSAAASETCHTPTLSMDTFEGRLMSVLVRIPAELRYFAVGKPTYSLPDERPTEDECKLTSMSINTWCNLVFVILLDVNQSFS